MDIFGKVRLPSRSVETKSEMEGRERVCRAGRPGSRLAVLLGRPSSSCLLSVCLSPSEGLDYLSRIFVGIWSVLGITDLTLPFLG